MFDKPLKWLKRKWWGLIVAYSLLFLSIYLIIWQFAEPMGIPEYIQNMPDLVKTRAFIHIILTLLLAAYFTLILDLVLRKELIVNSQSYKDEEDRTHISITRCKDTESCLIRTIQSVKELDSVFSFPDNALELDYLDAIAKSECLLEGHFKLVSGKHSSRFIRFEKIIQNSETREFFAHKMAASVSNIHFSRIIGPSGTAGGNLAHETARVLHSSVTTFPAAYSKRMLNVNEPRAKELLGEKCLYIDDLTTTGGGIISTVENLRKNNICVVGVAVVFVRDILAAEAVRRRLKEIDIEFTYLGYADLTSYTWDETDCKLCRLIYSQDLN